MRGWSGGLRPNQSRPRHGIQGRVFPPGSGVTALPKLGRGGIGSSQPSAGDRNARGQQEQTKFVAGACNHTNLRLSQ